MSDESVTTGADGSVGGTPATATAGRSLIGDAGKATTTNETNETAPKPVVAETWWKGYFKEDGSVDKSRLAHLPEEMKGDKALFDRFNKADDFFKSYAHHARLAREKGLTPLREGATEQEVAEHIAKVAKANGAPDKPEGYGLKKPEGVDDAMWDQGYADSMAKVFHKHGLSPSAVKEITAASIEAQKAAMESIQAEQAKASDAHWAAQEKALRDAFGPYKDERIKEAVAGARWMGIDPQDPAFTGNASLIIAAAKVASKISEAKFVDGTSQATSGRTAQQEIDSIANDAGHKYYDVMRNPSKNPRLYEEAIAYRRKLTQQLSAERTASR